MANWLPKPVRSDVELPLNPSLRGGRAYHPDVAFSYRAASECDELADLSLIQVNGSAENLVSPARPTVASGKSRCAKTTIFLCEFNLICPVQPDQKKYLTSVFQKHVFSS
jgi:hypothetical protein